MFPKDSGPAKPRIVRGHHQNLRALSDKGPRGIGKRGLKADHHSVNAHRFQPLARALVIREELINDRGQSQALPKGAAGHVFSERNEMGLRVNRGLPTIGSKKKHDISDLLPLNIRSAHEDGDPLFFGGAGKGRKVLPLNPQKRGRGVLRDHDEIHIVWGLAKKILVASQNFRKLPPIQAVRLAYVRLDQGKFDFSFGPGIGKSFADSPKKKGTKEREEEKPWLFWGQSTGPGAQGYGEGEKPGAREASGGHKRASRQGHRHRSERESQGARGPGRLQKGPASSENKDGTFPARKKSENRKEKAAVEGKNEDYGINHRPDERPQAEKGRELQEEKSEAEEEPQKKAALGPRIAERKKEGDQSHPDQASPTWEERGPKEASPDQHQPRALKPCQGKSIIMALMHPVFLRIGPFEIRYYGLMYVISFIVGYFIVRAMSKRKGLPLRGEDILDIFLVTIPLGILFARLYYVAFNWEFYRRAPWEIPAVWHGGLAIHGGLLGGVLGLLISAKWKKVPFWSLADIAVPAVALGQVLGRIGNFLNGDAFGTPTTLPWGVVFPLDSPAGAAYPGQPLHPAMLYEALGNLLIFLGLWRLSKVSARPGFLAAVYFVLYGLVRFPCEFVRGDALWLGPFRAAQVASALLILGFGSWLLLAKPWRVAPKPKSQ